MSEMLRAKLSLLRSSAIASHFAPSSVESGWHELWQRHTSRPPTRRSGDSVFSCLLPPPNVTGELHVGHALTVSIQDAVVRRHRMLGHDVLWVPGLDHAGIATQAVVERSIRPATRLELGRERFVERVWAWKHTYGDRINEQLRRVGASLDWQHEFFSLDRTRSDAVDHAFVRLFDDGLVYRADRLVMWCPALQTVLSDIEVDFDELPGRTPLRTPQMRELDAPVEFGVLYDVAYAVVGGGGGAVSELVVSTTRPETLFADVAVAVHPDDARYATLGADARVRHPLTGRELPVVRDAALVDMQFGTGVVKVTPAHDADDFECGRRHKLPVVRMFELDGRANAVAGRFAGTDRLALRALVVAELARVGAHRGEKSHATRVPRCSRTGDVLEPMLMPQWYVRSSALAQRAADAARSGELEVLPHWQQAEWTRWLDKCGDWCVSRQLWWGHRVPAYCAVDDATGAPTDRWTAALSEEDARRKLQCARVRRDDDVLDTWFAASLLPLAALGWPHADAAAHIKRFYPLSLLETGSDIIFFWAARMAMMCAYLAPDGQLPFKQLLLHALVRDAKGRKMSKSLGNVINPLHVQQGATLAELCDYMSAGNLSAREQARALESLRRDYPNGMPQCGTDALRISLLLYTEQSRSINLDMARIFANTKFCNKVWNATRFALDALAAQPRAHWLALDDLLRGAGAEARVGVAPMSRWMLSRLAACVAAVNADFDAYRLSQAAATLQRSFVDEFCDVYIESCKRALKLADAGDALRVDALETLSICLETYLRLLHPVMPFITEELWHRLLLARGDALAHSDDATLMAQQYPVDLSAHAFDGRAGQLAIDVAHAIRSLESVTPVAAARHFTVHGRRELGDLLDDIATLSRVRAPHTLAVASAAPASGALQRAAADDVVVSVVIESASAASKQTDVLLDALEKRLKRLNERFASGRERMAAPQYATRVPASVRERDEREQQALAQQIAETEAEVKSLIVR
jgi:valyl-tRNA synthetase